CAASTRGGAGRRRSGARPSDGTRRSGGDRTDARNGDQGAGGGGRARPGTPAATRARGDEDGDAADRAVRRRRAEGERRRGRPSRRRRGAGRARGLIAPRFAFAHARGSLRSPLVGMRTVLCFAACWWAARPSRAAGEPYPELKKLLKLHRGAHVALDLQLAGHVCRPWILLPSDELLVVSILC